MRYRADVATGIIELRRIAIFLATGLATALLFFGLMALLLDGFDMGYRMAVTVAYACAIVFHFTINRHITFSSRDEHILRQAVRYAMLALTSYLITLAVVSYMVEKLRFSPYAGALIALVVTTAFGYCISKAWVFRRRLGNE
jgi:putative flippase GtrA